MQLLIPAVDCWAIFSCPLRGLLQASKIATLCPRGSNAPAPIPTDRLASLAFDLATLALQLDLLRRSFRAGRPSLVTKLNHLARDSHHTQAYSCRIFPVHAYRVSAANRHMAAMELTEHLRIQLTCLRYEMLKVFLAVSEGIRFWQRR